MATSPWAKTAVTVASTALFLYYVLFTHETWVRTRVYDEVKPRTPPVGTLREICNMVPDSLNQHCRHDHGMRGHNKPER